MIRSSVRCAGLALLLSMNGCGALLSNSDAGRTPSLSVAEAALQGGSAQIALQVSEGVLRQSPSNLRALEIKGDALTLLGDYDQAGAIFQALIVLEPNSVRANIGLGRIRLSKDPAGAEALFQTVLKRDPKNLTALNNLGIARDLQGHHAEAQAAYRIALAANPDLDSAQVNLALSMAMSGQGPAAVRMLTAKAAEPGAPVKVRHDYAVVLALAGRRSEAERVLSESMGPDDVRQMLDNVTGTHTKVAPEPRSIADAGDAIPPDVVQVPEVPAAPARPALAARPAPMPTIAAVSAAPVIAAAAPPPAVVRPQQTQGGDNDAPGGQPVTPVSAAITYQHPLAAPMRAADLAPAAGDPPPPMAAAPAAMAPGVVAPEVVSMPPARPAPPVLIASASAVRAPVPEAPPAATVAMVTPVPAPRQEPRTVQPVAASVAPARPMAVQTAAVQPAAVSAAPISVAPLRPAAIQPPAAQPAVRATPVAAPRVLPAPASPPAVAAAVPVPAKPLPAPIVLASRTIDPPAAGAAHHDAGEAAVQFAAASSEEAAHAYWAALVRRFPDALGQRAPAVIRFERNGTVFWRVRTEPLGSLSEAQALCARMRAGGQDCFVPRS